MLLCIYDVNIYNCWTPGGRPRGPRESFSLFSYRILLLLFLLSLVIIMIIIIICMCIYTDTYIHIQRERERERYYCFVFSCSGEVILFEISSSTKPYPYVARACAGRLGPAVGFLEPVFFLFGFYFLGLFVNSYYGFMFLSFLFGGNPTTTYESQTTNGKFRIRVLHRLTEACGGLFGADRYILPTRLPTDEASNRVPRG